MKSNDFFSAVSLMSQGKYSDALDVLRKSISNDKDNADLYNLAGLILLELDRLPEALEFSLAAVRLSPDDFAVQAALGLVWQGLAEFGKAETCFRKVVELAPENADSHNLLGNLLLLTGQLEEGWKEYEWRLFNGVDGLRVMDKNYIPGTDLNGKRIYIHAEQGFGDTILFCRYLKLLKKPENFIIFECPAELAGLLKNTAGADFCGPVQPGNKPLQDYDVSVSLMSLPGICNTRAGNIPADIPYIKADEPLSRLWHTSFSNLSNLKIGFVWKSKYPNSTFQKRSCSIESFYNLAREIPPATFFSLQKGPFENEINKFPVRPNFFSLSKNIESFSDTAAIIENLDILISVDTSVVHLAGAMGKKVWLLLSYHNDWRWFLNRDDSPWYPSVKIFRQPYPGNWNAVFAKVKEELLGLVYV
jgi:hypothetical protein